MEQKEKLLPKSNYAKQFDEIISQGVTPENIDTYADEALQKLIDLIKESTESYDKQPTIAQHGVDEERAALSYAGLDPAVIEQTLDHIGDVAEKIHNLDELIDKRIVHDEYVAVPPNGDSKPEIHAGNGNFEKKKQIDRTKTILLIASQLAGVDLEDETEWSIRDGVLNDNMMRKTSYNLVEFHDHSRAFLVCDEEGNVTYGFDTAMLSEHGISADELFDLPKDDIDELLRESPSMGRRIIYSNQFTKNVYEAIGQPFTSKVAIKIDMPNILKGYEDVEEGYMSVVHMSKLWGVSPATVYKVVSVLNDQDQIGPIIVRRFRTATGIAYSPAQQATIHNYLDQKGYLVESAADPDELTASGMAKLWGMTQKPVNRVIDELNEQGILGETVRRKFVSRIATVYSPTQQEMIRSCLASRGGFEQQANAEYLSVAGLSNLWGIADSVINKAIAELRTSLGDTTVKKFGSQPATAYSPDQQAIIHDHLESKGTFSSVRDGYIHQQGMVRLWGISEGTIKNVLSDLSAQDLLGEVENAKLGSRVTKVYSPEQQAIIYDRLLSNGIFTEKAADSLLSAVGISRAFGVSVDTVNRAIKNLEEQGTLGEVVIRKFRRIDAKAYTPAQQETIREWIKRNTKATFGRVAVKNS